jgi:putative ABC transport system permease protein
MLANYLKTAYRNLLKNKLYSGINLLGLTIGMTACLLIMHYIVFEKSYDQFHPDKERIYRLRYERTDEKGDAVRFASCCPPAAAHIRDNYPEVEKIARLLHYQAIVAYNDTKFLEERMYFAEPDLFNILKFNFTKGDPTVSLRDPNNAFISQSIAKKYFGNENPIGKTISIDKKDIFQIVGLFEDVPRNSHLKFDILLPWEKVLTLYGTDYTEAWGHTGSYTYLRVKVGTDPQAFEKKLLPLVEKECPWLKEYKMTIDLKMQPLKDIRLNSHYMQEYESNGDRDTVNFLLIIAVFIIIIAWVNYINLSTARSLGRAREVGVRKVVGASRGQLIVQLFLETIIVNTAAIGLTFVIINMILPYFSQLAGMPLDTGLWNHSWFWLALVAMFVAGVFLSGLYPVIAMTSYKPVIVLKGQLSRSDKGTRLRKTLVAFQFIIAIGLIIGTMTVYRQLSYMRNQKLGFDMDQILVMKAPRVRDANFEGQLRAFREELLTLTGINKFCVVTETPGRQVYWDAGAIHKAGEDDSKGKNYQIVGIDYDFADVFGVELMSGRNFSKEFPADKNGLIFNETAVKWMGFESSEAAVGQQVDYWGEIFTIVGVFKNYHQQSLKQAFEPHIFRLMPTGRGVRGHFAIKMNGQNVRKSLELAGEKYAKFFPGNPFDFYFLDDYYNKQYQGDELVGMIVAIFAFLAIFVTCLGIFGLSSFITLQRIKEIGIRKVLGATVFQLVSMFYKFFVKWILVAALVACPVTWHVMNKWLDNYAYRINLSWWIFALAGGIALIIALLTVSWQAIRAATANPVEALRYE